MKTRFGVLLILALALSGCGVSPTGVSSGASSDTTTTRVSPAVEVEAELEFEQALERERYMEEVLAPSSSAAQLPEGAIFWPEAWGYVGMSGTLCGPVVNEPVNLFVYGVVGRDYPKYVCCFGRDV